MSHLILCNCKKEMSHHPKIDGKVITQGEDGMIVGYASGTGEFDFL